MKLIASVILVMVSFSGIAQPAPKKIKELKSKEVAQLVVDRLGDFFTVTTSGEIKKFDPDGKMFSRLKSRTIKPTLVEPWYHPSIFVFDRNNQKYFFFDRHFENVREYAVEPSWAVEPFLICPRGDNRLLVLDKADYSIKLVNPLTNQLQSEFAIDAALVASNPEFSYMREYQNMIFLLDSKSGIIILSNIGKLISKIEVAGINNFNFFGEEMYYLSENKINFFDLYSEEKRTIPLDGNYRFALATDERIIAVSDKNKIVLYEHNPVISDN
jgi:hypothetical protein